jgi:hypothetical protein
VALQAQYIFDRFGKFPGTVPSMIATIYLQAHHLDLEFYDEFYKIRCLPANPRGSHGAMAWRRGSRRTVEWAEAQARMGRPHEI